MQRQLNDTDKSLPINIYCEFRWLEFSNEKTEWLKGKKNKWTATKATARRSSPHAVYKRLTSTLKTHISAKWGDGKRYPCNYKSKENRDLYRSNG